MRAGKTEAKGTSGQSHVKAWLEEQEWAVATNPEHDLGTELWVQPQERPRHVLPGTRDRRRTICRAVDPTATLIA